LKTETDGTPLAAVILFLSILFRYLCIFLSKRMLKDRIFQAMTLLYIMHIWHNWVKEQGLSI
jgi:hypothetical protein